MRPTACLKLQEALSKGESSFSHSLFLILPPFLHPISHFQSSDWHQIHIEALTSSLLHILCVFVYQIILTVYAPYTVNFIVAYFKAMLVTFCHVNSITINSTEHVLTSQCSIEGMMMGENALNNPHSKLQYSRWKSDFFPLHLQCECICAVPKEL